MTDYEKKSLEYLSEIESGVLKSQEYLYRWLSQIAALLLAIVVLLLVIVFKLW